MLIRFVWSLLGLPRRELGVRLDVRTCVVALELDVRAELTARRSAWKRFLPAQTNDDARFLTDRALACLWDRTGADRTSPNRTSIARVLETCGGITLVATLAFGLGFWVSFQVVPFRLLAARGVRRRYAFGARFLTVLSLLVYGWIIHWVGWSKMVRTNWGLGGSVLVDDFVVFLPYLSIQLLVWWGLFFAERAPADPSGLARDEPARAVHDSQGTAVAGIDPAGDLVCT